MRASCLVLRSAVIEQCEGRLLTAYFHMWDDRGSPEDTALTFIVIELDRGTCT